MKQYEIWWADLPKPAGRRPVLLLNRDDSGLVAVKVPVIVLVRGRVGSRLGGRIGSRLLVGDLGRVTKKG